MPESTKIFLKPKEEKEILQGFPWVYDNEIAAVDKVPLSQTEAKDGSVVEVFSSAGNFLGTGVLNRASRIAVRIIGRERAEHIMADSAAYYMRKIRAACELRQLYYRAEDSYRLVFAESDGIPGLIVERYCDTERHVHLVVQFLSLSCEVFRKEILSALRRAARPWGVYERSDAPVRQKEGLPLRSCWEGEVRQKDIIIEENGVRLAVDIADGQKTGYFLDQKDNRRVLAALCKGKSVLDAFCHSGAFGLNAVRGGAASVIAADISPEAVELARRNISLNGADSVMSVVCADVFDLLKQYEAEGRKFDVIVLDPPAFTKSAKLIQKAYGGYKEINLRAMRLLNDGGILVSCSCSYFFDRNTFYSMLMHAAEDSHVRVQVLAKRGAGADHPVLLGYPKSEYLKCAVCRITRA